MPVPGRIDAALQFILFAERVKNPVPVFDGMKPEPRDLSAKEGKVEDAALGVLLDYFECKADFGDDPKRLTVAMREKKEADEKKLAEVEGKK